MVVISFIVFHRPWRARWGTVVEVVSMPEKLLQYDVIERLGEGAGSVIYAVRDPATKRMYALEACAADQ